MKINRKQRIQYLFQNSFFILLFIALIFLLGVVANQYVFVKDMTQASRSVLTKGSIEILKKMDGPVNFTVFATNDDANKGDNFRKGLLDFISKYQREKKDIQVEFINPTLEPKLVEDLGIRTDGEVIVEYNKRTEHITPPFAEQELTNLLVRLARTNNKPIMYLDGHGEKNLLGLKNHDLGAFGEQLERKGFKFSNPDLTALSEVPKEGAMLVIASPQVPVTKPEAQKIFRYVENGGNIFWLLDEDNYQGLDELAVYLGLQISDGKVVDKSSLNFGSSEDISYALVYGDHPITRNFMLRTQYSDAYQIQAKDSYENGWEVSDLIEVAPNGWLSSNKKPQDDKLIFDKEFDKKGPINIAVALKRKYGDKGQRVVVVGNASFLSNYFITSGGNLDLGINMINWLAGDDQLITIQPKPLKDVNVNIPGDDKGRLIAWTIFHLFQYFIPIGLFVLGFWVWYKRRKA